MATTKGLSHKSWQHDFSYMFKHNGIDKSGNLNARTIGILTQMADYYDRTDDHWSLTAYRRAVFALRKQNHKVLTKEQASAILFVGERLAAKIEEIVWTNRLQTLESTTLEPNDKTLQTLLKIYGVGHPPIDGKAEFCRS